MRPWPRLSAGGGQGLICTPNVPTSVARPGVGGKSMHFPSRGRHHTASLGALGLVDPPLTGPQKRLADASGPRAVYSVNEPQPPCGVAPDSGPGLFSSKASAGHQARQAPGSPRLPSPCLRAGDCPGSRPGSKQLPLCGEARCGSAMHTFPKGDTATRCRAGGDLGR